MLWLSLIDYVSGFFFSVGIGIALSDLVYHFAVLWPIVGSPDFMVIIKDIGKFEVQQRRESRLLKRFVKHIGVGSRIRKI